ncbi:MAG: ABC transporter ATP-binding protein [Candidatus Dojkabacteria bacterium]
MSNVALKVENISKSFKIHHGRNDSLREAFVNMFHKKKSIEIYEALNNISFEIKKGEFVGIIGKNGAGKSTLLKIISGIYQPDRGNITVNGKVIPFLELGVGFNHDLSARDNVFLNGIILGMTKKEVEEKYDEIIDFAEVSDFQDMPLKNFSSGMQVRLAFSIAIQAKGDILILDEVLAVGDTNFQLKCLDVFKRFKKEKKTIILVTHSEESIRKFCSKVFLINKSKVEEYEDVGVGLAVYNGISISEQNPGKKKTKRSEYLLSEIHSDKRWGSGEILIKDVLICDSNGDESVLFNSGEDIYMYISIIETEKGILNTQELLHYGVAISSQNDDYVFGTNTLLTNDGFSPKDSKVCVQFKSPKLLSGRYSINVSIFGDNDEKPFDWVGSVAEFEVLSSTKFHGVVRLEHSWRKIK